jgi:hypothetical protein
MPTSSDNYYYKSESIMMSNNRNIKFLLHRRTVLVQEGFSLDKDPKYFGIVNYYNDSKTGSISANTAIPMAKQLVNRIVV